MARKAVTCLTNAELTWKDLFSFRPTIGNTGFVNIEVTTPYWLQFDRFGTSAVNPERRASFWLYQERRNVIFTREVH